MACRVCQKTFNSATDTEYDSDAKPHVCSICGQSFSLKIQLKRHTLMHANGEPFTCVNCSKDDEDSTSYNLRLSKKGSYTCETCGMSFPSKRNLLKHTNEEHTFESSHFCDDCPEIFDSASELKKHAATHKSKSVAKRRISKAESNDDSSFEPSLTCPTCDQNFVYQASFDKHVSKCNADDYSEPKKSTSSPAKKSKKNHVEVFENSNRKHECSVCGKSFSRKTALEGHQLVHFQQESDYPSSDSEPEKPQMEITKSFICMKCNFVCFSQMTLAKHQCRNAEEANDDPGDSKPKKKEKHKCSECSAGFRSSEELKQHMMVHSENESFRCDICEKKFRSEKRLNRHMRSHDVEDSDPEDEESPRKRGSRPKEYQCEICGKEFVGEKCLKKHVRKHQTGEVLRRKRRKKSKTNEIYSCSYCSEEFVGRKSAYLKHLHVHLPEVCGICDERFVDRKGLQEHCKVHIGTEEGKLFVECSQKALDAKNGLIPPEPKVEYIYLVLR